MGHYVIFLFLRPRQNDPERKFDLWVMGEPESPWPTREKWNPGHGKPGKAMTYKRKIKFRSWETRKAHDLQEKNEIQAMENPERSWPTGEKWNSDHRGNGNSRSRRFCLFRMNLYKINHARRNFTFTSKITPRVNFYYLICS